MGLLSSLGTALTLMFTGMGFVFAFLGFLVYIIPLIQKYAPEDPIPAPKPVRKKATSNVIPEDVMAAITIAVEKYRKR